MINKQGVLTIDILNKAIDNIKRFEFNNEVVGFKINPADLREIKEGMMEFCGVVNNALVVIPPYQGLRLEPDINQPRGYVHPIRRNNGN